VLTLRGTPEISLIMTGGGENEETGFIQRQERILIPPQRGDFAAAMARRCQARGAMAISVAQTEATTAVLHCAGDLWRCGIAINWHALGPGPDARRIALPLPSLPRQRCWFQNEQTQPVANVVPAGGGQYRPVPPPTLCYRESWRRTGRCAPLGEDQRLGALVLIYQPGCRFARALGDLLKERHEQVARVMIGKSSAMRSGEHCLDWHDPLAASRLVERLTQQGRAPERLLLLFNDTVDYQAPAAGELFHTADIMLELARACSEHSRAPLTIDLIGPGFADVLGDEPVSPACAAALAAALSLTQEMPHIACYCIDVAAKPNAGRDEARAILAEIAGAGYAGGRPAISALRNGWRWQRRFTPWVAAVGAEPLVNLTCLVAGGLGNVGYRLARHLAIHYQARLVLLIHAPLRATPDHRHYAQRLRELQTHARQVEVIVGDVADVTRLSALLPGAEQRVGAAINCFIHAAGHSGGQTLHWVQKSTRGQWQGLMRPKFTGAVALHSVLGQRKLQFGCFISSLAVYAGGLGLAAYAAANAACAAFAQLHSRSHPYLTMDWDGWPGWNRQGSFKYAASRARPLEYHEIISAFEMALGSRSAGGRLAISTEPMDARLAPACAVTEPGPAAGADLSREEIGTALMDIWHNCLQCEIDQNANFFDLGGDSLIGAGLVRRINTRFGIGLTMVDLFEAAAIAPLADRICQALPSRQPCRPRQGGDDDE